MPPPTPPPAPEFVTITVCEASSLLPNPYCPKTAEKQFLKGTEPTTQCGIHKKPEPPPEYVTVSVCSTSGLLSGIWCPKTEARKFEKGKQPTTQCSVHKAPEKAKKPLFVFLPDLLTAEGDLEKFIKTVRENGAWGIRFFACYSWGRGWQLTPYVQVGNWKHPTTGKVFPYFDLTKWNSAYSSRLETILALFKKYELEAVVSVHDIRLKDKNEKYFHPFYCSIQALAGWSTGGVYGDPLKLYHKALATKIIGILKSSGVMFRIEPGNEFSDLGWLKQGHPEVPKKWYAWFVKEIIAQGVPADRLIHSGWKDAVSNQLGIFSAHRVVRIESIPGSLAPMKTLISGDGGYDGSGRADAEGRKGISIEEAKEMAGVVLIKKYCGYEVMDRGCWKRDNANARLSDFDPACVKAMVAIFNQ